MADNYYLGIDTGSVTTSVVLMNDNGDIVNSMYEFHHGHPLRHLTAFLHTLPEGAKYAVAINTGTPLRFKHAREFDERVATIHAVKKFSPDCRTLLVVGGEKFGLIEFDERGNYLNFKGNTSCAAGTGSFLDQQAKRLNLSSIEEFSEIALQNSGDAPKIASRCSVFAKTDIIHAQQEGYTLAQICDGLTQGLAKNVVDTLFTGNSIPGSFIFAGGVALNGAVVRHINSLTGKQCLVPERPQHIVATGIAQLLKESADKNFVNHAEIIPIDVSEKEEKAYYFPPLELQLSQYPDFSSYRSYRFRSKFHFKATDVEVDCYTPPADTTETFMLGIDIGSTSTKAVLLRKDGTVFAGLYTRTSGRPVEAVQTLFEAILDLGEQMNVTPVISGLATTGSGRKLIGTIFKADTIIDEITAHARAAYELDPDVDTIIEIGGQDAKFTTMHNGMVTFSIMNNVCAAGTGSFIEEQAKKLHCPIEEYTERTLGMSSPLSSDRCTVFMERDLNHYFTMGYTVNEILTSVLHSIRDNYLSKVAVEKNIGNKIFFQGATAKNKSLVAAFEQRLKKPIMVSPFCHLTGALGAALVMKDEMARPTEFRGLHLFKSNIPIESEICELCSNHCKVKIADVHGEKAAYGFLCGRDFESETYVRQGLSHDIIAMRKRHFKPQKLTAGRSNGVILGIPAGLHLSEELPMWEYFFTTLGFSVITGTKYKNAVKIGKKAVDAEFCAPINSFVGQVLELDKEADYLFVPAILMSRERPANKQLMRFYCYYTQFASSLVAGLIPEPGKLLSPLIYYFDSGKNAADILHGMLESISPQPLSRKYVRQVYNEAVAYYESGIANLKNEAASKISAATDITVVLTGRPYTLLNDTMNSKIPSIFSRQGVLSLYQEMIDYGNFDFSSIDPLINAQPWSHGAAILKAAYYTAMTPGLYPVLVTSFKCSPDSFIIDYFKDVLDTLGKPYLVLQLDDHDSSIGYETRIEAAIRSFRNHAKGTLNVKKPSKDYNYNPKIYSHRTTGSSVLEGKTLLIPSWDHIACSLITANLRGAGIDARLLEESPSSIQRSLAHNNGQCIPLNAIAQNAIDFIEKYGLDPSKTVLWSIEARLACNIRMFPYYTDYIFKNYGKGMEKVGIYQGELTFYDISSATALNAYYGYMIGGMLTKTACKIRPYEIEEGMTDRTINMALNMLSAMFENRSDRHTVLQEISEMLSSIPVRKEKRPKVAIFGDLYARDNDVMNGDLVRFIERHGGEVITTPYSDYLKMIADPYLDQLVHEGYPVDSLLLRVLFPIASTVEKKIYKYFEPILKEPLMEKPVRTKEILEEFNVKYFQNGESFDNLLKILSLIERYPDISFFVQTNPAFCCPSLVTEAMADQIERKTGKPIVTVTYDGTGGNKNDVLIPYLTFPRDGEQRPTIGWSGKQDRYPGKAVRTLLKLWSLD